MHKFRFLFQFAILLSVVCYQPHVSEAFQAPELSGQQPADVNNRLPDDDLQELIAQLNSQEFGVRRQAASRLWQMGPEIAPQLRVAIEKSSGDARHHLQEIVRLFEIGIDADTPSELARLMVLFTDGSYSVRYLVVDQLNEKDEYALVIELLSQIEDQTQRLEFYNDYVYLTGWLIQLAASENWSDFDQIIANPLLSETDDKGLRLMQILLDGTIHEEIAAIQNKVQMKTAVDVDLIRLTQLLSATEDYAGAKAYANKISNVADRESILRTLNLLRGNYKEVIGEGLDDINDQTEKLCREMALAFLSGDLQGLELLSETAVERLKAFPVKLSPVDKLAYDSIISTLLKTLQFDDAIEHLRSDKQLNLFPVLIECGRYDAAFEELGLGEDVESRFTWFSRKLRNLRSLDKRYERNGDMESYSQAQNAFTNFTGAFSLLGRLGYRDEAVHYVKTLMDETSFDGEDSEERRSMLVRQLVELEAHDELWKVVESRFRAEQDEYWNLTDDLFGDNKMAVADFWYMTLKNSHVEIVPRLKLIAKLIGCPLGNEKLNVDLEQLVSSVNFEVATSDYFSVDELHFYIAQTYYYNGYDYEYEVHLQKAAELGNGEAASLLGEKHFAQQRYRLALKYFDQAWKGSYSPLDAIRAAQCLDELGQTDRANKMRIVALGCFQNGYGYGYYELDNFIHLGLRKEVHPLAKVFALSGRDGAETEAAYTKNLAQTLAPQLARQVATLEKFEFAGTSSYGMDVELLPFSISDSMEIARREAIALISEGKTKQAAQWVRLLFACRHGDSTTAEKVLPELDRAGESELCSELFKELEADFADKLSQYPDSPLFHNSYAWSCACNSRRLDFAKENAEAAVALRPNNPSYLDTLAEIAYRMKQPEKATELMKKCLQLAPDSLYYKKQLRRFEAGEK